MRACQLDGDQDRFSGRSRCAPIIPRTARPRARSSPVMRTLRPDCELRPPAARRCLAWPGLTAVLVEEGAGGPELVEPRSEETAGRVMTSTMARRMACTHPADRLADTPQPA